MTLRQIQQRVLRLTRNVGTYHGVAEASDVNSLIDEALARIAQQCYFFDPAIRFNITADQAIYRLDSSAFEKRIVKPYRVNMDGVILCDSAGLPGLWTAREFEIRFPGFLSADSGDPFLAVWNGPTLRLYFAPSATYTASASAYVSAEYVPGWVDGDDYYASAASAPTSSSPDLPIEFHELVPELAAHLGSVGVADSEQAWAIVSARQKNVVSQLDRLRRKNRESMSAVPYRPGAPRIDLNGL